MSGAEVAMALRLDGKEPTGGWDEVLHDLFNGFIRLVRKSTPRSNARAGDKETRAQDWESAAGLWKQPTPEIVEGFCIAVARALRQRRYVAGRTLSEVVVEAQTLEGGSEFSSPYLSQLETGAARPSIARLGLFARLYNVPMPALFQDAELLLAQGLSQEPNEPLDDLKEKTEQLARRVSTLHAALQKGVVPRDRVERAHQMVPLVEALLNTVAAMEEPSRRPGRPRKAGAS
jgi:transcriptional regulator with XRE-family HTH domain